VQTPAVQYVITPDGFNIAYTVCGEGVPFVFMPWPFSHRGLWWGTAFGRPIAEALSSRFRLVQYDSRGQGMSTRGLPEYHSSEDYVLDLEAVINRLALDRFVLYGGPGFFNAAVVYAVRHPEHIAGLILGDLTLDFGAFGGDAMLELARRDWDLFLHTMVSSFSLLDAPRELKYWRDSVSQQDWLRMVSGAKADARRNPIKDLLPQVQVPTLILNSRILGPDEPALRSLVTAPAIMSRAKQGVNVSLRSGSR
jgi:pimeloyl-ACP methyl ester carboxylesterase